MEVRALGGWIRGCLLLVASFALLAAPASAAPALHVIPFPNTPDASALSNIIFSSLTPPEVTNVDVTGSSSGPHSGTLEPLPDQAGTAFVPAKAFTPGEQVTVSATLSSAAAYTALGDPGASSVDFSFTVGTPASQASGASRGPAGALSALSAPQGPPTQSFRSAPGLHPPVINATSSPGTAPGDIFLSPIGAGESGPMIVDRRGRLVWFDPVPSTANNVMVQSYRGERVLTWWQGRIFQGNGIDGKDVIMNRSYQTLAVLHGGYGYSSDPHEFQLTPQGTALIDAFVPVQTDLSSVGGPSNGVLMDCVIQELDVKTGQVLWEWHALGHVPLSASYMPVNSNKQHFGYFHLNSIQQLSDGNFLISARNTWAVYEINRATGEIMWTLGGKDSSYQLGKGATFEWQHDARLLPGNVVSVFDDAADPQEESQSSAKLIHLDPANMTATLVRRYNHSPPLLAGATGNAQVLPNGDVFVGWGTAGQFSEYTGSGRQIFNGSVPAGVYSYRVYRFPWNAQPLTRPALALARQSNGSVKIYASWNGATQVASWRVLAGSRPGALSRVDQAQRTGFQTVVTLHTPRAYVAVQALDGQGRVLGTSQTHAVGH